MRELGRARLVVLDPPEGPQQQEERLLMISAVSHDGEALAPDPQLRTQTNGVIVGRLDKGGL